MTSAAVAPTPERPVAARRGRSARGDRRALLLDGGMLVLAASVRVILERLHGLEHAAGDLGTLFIPNFAWWWAEPRWLGGWNPWVFAGYPSNADPQVGSLHPFGVLYALASPFTAAAVDGVLSPAAAGIGMLLYLRQMGCGRAGSLVGALSFELGGFVAAQASHPAHLRAAIAVPWALAAIEVFDGSALIAGLGAATAAIVVSGHPQLMAYALAVVAAYAVWRGRPTAPGRAATLGAGLALGIGVGAASWLPALQLIGLSTHGFAAGGPAHADVAGRLTPVHLAGLVVPFAAGGGTGPLYGTAPDSLACSVTECGGYPGMLAWLAILACVPALLRDPSGRFWLIIGAAGLVLASGLVGVVPPLAEVRAPARFLLWVDLAAAAAAALALRSAEDRPPSAARWLAAGAAIAVLIACASLLGWKASRAAGASAGVLAVTVLAVMTSRGRPGRWLVAVAAADLVAFSASIPLGVPASAVRGTTRVLEAIREARDGAGATDRAVVLPFFGGSNWAPLERVPILQGYNAMVLRSLAAMLGADPAMRVIEIGWITDPGLASDGNHVLDLLRCRTVAALTWAHDPLSEAIDAAAGSGSTRWQRLGHAEAARAELYVNRRARPVAWLVHRVRVAAPDEALRLVRGEEGGLDPASEAVVDRPIAELAAPPHDEPPVEVRRYAEDEIRLAADAATPALLVTSELAYPGWTATVDGRRAPLWTANAGFRAVVLPAGRHEVVLAYRPPIARLGLALSAASLTALIFCAVRRRIRAA